MGFIWAVKAAGHRADMDRKFALRISKACEAVPCSCWHL